MLSDDNTAVRNQNRRLAAFCISPLRETVMPHRSLATVFFPRSLEPASACDGWVLFNNWKTPCAGFDVTTHEGKELFASPQKALFSPTWTKVLPHSPDPFHRYLEPSVSCHGDEEARLMLNSWTPCPLSPVAAYTPGHVTASAPSCKYTCRLESMKAELLESVEESLNSRLQIWMDKFAFYQVEPLALSESGLILGGVPEICPAPKKNKV